LRTSGKNIVVISQSNHQNLNPKIQATLQECYTRLEEKFILEHLDVESQKKVLNETVDFQGKEVTLEKLIGEDPTDKKHIVSDVLSSLMGRKEKLCVGKKLGDRPSYYVPRTLQRRVVYVNDTILKETDKEIKSAITGLEENELE
jgi:hypothetical protein